MPVINIALFKGKTTEEKINICKTIQKVLKSAFKIEHNNFHCRINEYAESEMIVPSVSSKNYLAIEIDFLPGRSISEKNIFYKNIKEELHALKINDNDILIIIREPILENWFIRGKTGQEMKNQNQEKINIKKST